MNIKLGLGKTNASLYAFLQNKMLKNNTEKFLKVDAEKLNFA